MAVTDRYRTPGDLPAELAVFPLRGCILLPRATLPLSVFESRYLEMIDHVLSSNRLLGIVQPAAEEGAAESPAGKSALLRGIGCAGRLTGFEELADGRMAIVLTGVSRFSVVREIETSSAYRSMRVDFDRFAQDLQRGHGEQDVDRAALLAILKTYLEAKRLQADWQAIEQSGSELLINALSLTSPYGPEEKQALLEAPTLKQRADVLVALARMELAAGPRGDPQGRLQ